MESFLFSAFVFLTAAVLVVPIANRLGFGSVLGYLLAGVVIGPYVLSLVSNPGDVMHSAEFGVVMMLFIIGLELQPSKLWRLRKSILGTGGAQVALTTLAVMGIAMALSFSWQMALAIGMGLALSSTAIVLQTLNEKNLTDTSGGRASFSVLLFQDIAVIPILAIMPLLATQAFTGDASHGAHGLVHGLPGWQRAVITIGAVIAIVIAGRFLLRPVFRYIARTRIREMFTALALLIVIGSALLMMQLELSPALGAFLAGVVLADSEYRHELETDIEPFKGLLMGLFFLAVGASINFNVLAEHPASVTSLVVGLIAVKAVILFAIGKVFRLHSSQNWLFTFALAQGGEFAFVIFELAEKSGVLREHTVELLIVVVAISMAITPLLMILNDKFVQPRFASNDERPQDTMEDEDNPVIIAGMGRFGQMVGRVLASQNVGTTVLDHDPVQIDMLRRFGFKVFYGDATRLDLLNAAGAAKAKLFIIAVDDPAQALQLATMVKKNFPNLKVLARARNRPATFDLIKAEADAVVREVFLGSLDISRIALENLGYRRYQANRIIQVFAEHDENALRIGAEMAEDEEALINLAELSRQQFEAAMQSDLDDLDQDKNRGWG